MDSMLLLHLMSLLQPKNCRAIYIDHQLQPSSAGWGAFVEDACRQLDVLCVVHQVQVQDGNIENQARLARYQAFRQHILPHEVLVLAHHQQDQAETLLLRLFSGAGVQGLSAMRSLDWREGMAIWRPMLALSREQIADWCNTQQIQHIQDFSNFDTRYDRAWCREALWPLLQSRFPQFQQAVSRTSLLMQDADEILAEVLAQDMVSCGTSEALHLDKLQALNDARQRQLLSAWMRGKSQYRPPAAMVQRLIREVMGAKQDAQADLHWNGFHYVRYAGQLHRIAQSDYMQTHPLSSQTHQQFELGQTFQALSGAYKIDSCAEEGLDFALLEQELTLSLRQGGERIHLQGRMGSWPLKKALQQAQIFPWLRHTIQILSIDNVMLGVFTPNGFWLAESPYCVKAGWRPQLISSANSKTGFSS